LAPGGFINVEKSTMLSTAMFKQCDADDGVVDGIISKPQACTFNIASVRCEGGVDSGNTCLSDAQLKTYAAITSPLKTNFSFANGIQQVPGFTLFGPDFPSSFPAPLGASQAAAQKNRLSLRTVRFSMLFITTWCNTGLHGMPISTPYRSTRQILDR
jgi:feruloyl esterase